MRITRKVMAYMLMFSMIITAVPFNVGISFADGSSQVTVPTPSVRFAVVEKDDGSGYTFKETTNNGITLKVMNGTTHVQGAAEDIRENCAAHMDSVYYEAPNNENFNFGENESFTVSVLMREPEGNTSDYIIAKKHPPHVAGKAWHDHDSLWHVGNYTNDANFTQYGFRMGPQAYQGTKIRNQDFYEDHIEANNQWRRITYVFDGTKNTDTQEPFATYVGSINYSGKFDQTASERFQSPYHAGTTEFNEDPNDPTLIKGLYSDGVFHIGRGYVNYSAYDARMEGDIAKVEIWKGTALTAEQIDKLWRDDAADSRYGMDVYDANAATDTHERNKVTVQNVKSDGQGGFTNLGAATEFPNGALDYTYLDDPTVAPTGYNVSDFMGYLDANGNVVDKIMVPDGTLTVKALWPRNLAIVEGGNNPEPSNPSKYVEVTLSAGNGSFGAGQETTYWVDSTLNPKKTVADLLAVANPTVTPPVGKIQDGWNKANDFEITSAFTLEVNYADAIVAKSDSVTSNPDSDIYKEVIFVADANGTLTTNATDNTFYIAKSANLTIQNVIDSSLTTINAQANSGYNRGGWDPVATTVLNTDGSQTIRAKNIAQIVPKSDTITSAPTGYKEVIIDSDSHGVVVTNADDNTFYVKNPSNFTVQQFIDSLLTVISVQPNPHYGTDGYSPSASTNLADVATQTIIAKNIADIIPKSNSVNSAPVGYKEVVFGTDVHGSISTSGAKDNIFYVRKSKNFTIQDVIDSTLTDIEAIAHTGYHRNGWTPSADTVLNDDGSLNVKAVNRADLIANTGQANPDPSKYVQLTLGTTYGGGFNGTPQTDWYVDKTAGITLEDVLEAAGLEHAHDINPPAGMVFTGWDLDRTTVITQDITASPQYTGDIVANTGQVNPDPARYVTIELDPNGGNFPAGTQTSWYVDKTSGQTFEDILIAADIDKEGSVTPASGKTFTGWSIPEDTSITASMTESAQYADNIITDLTGYNADDYAAVTLDSGEGSFNTTTSSVITYYVYKNSGVTLNHVLEQEGIDEVSDINSPSGKTFKGWNHNKFAVINDDVHEIAQYTENIKSSLGAGDVPADYATVTLDANGGSFVTTSGGAITTTWYVYKPSNTTLNEVLMATGVDSVQSITPPVNKVYKGWNPLKSEVILNDLTASVQYTDKIKENTGQANPDPANYVEVTLDPEGGLFPLGTKRKWYVYKNQATFGEILKAAQLDDDEQVAPPSGKVFHGWNPLKTDTIVETLVAHPWYVDAADKTALINIINISNQLKNDNSVYPGDYNQDLINDFEQELNDAQAQKNDNNATQHNVDVATEDLEYAYSTLIKSLLIIEVQKEDAIKASDKYTNATTAQQNEYDNAVTNANTVLNDDNATLTQVNNALQRLKNALDGIVDKTALNAEALNEGVVRASDAYSYSSDAKKQAYDNALASANNVLNDPNATQAQVDSALSVLQNAKNALALANIIQVQPNTTAPTGYITLNFDAGLNGTFAAGSITSYYVKTGVGVRISDVPKPSTIADTGYRFTGFNKPATFVIPANDINLVAQYQLKKKKRRDSSSNSLVNTRVINNTVNKKEEDIIVREPEDVQQEQTKIVSEHNLTQEVIYDNASLTDNQIVDISAIGYDVPNVNIIAPTKLGSNVSRIPAVEDKPVFNKKHRTRMWELDTKSITPLKLDRTSRRAFMTGYPDKSFKPDATVTRSEVAMVVSNILGVSEYLSGEDYSMYKDITSPSWYTESVGFLTKHRIMGGFADGTFRPQNGMTRGELAQIVSQFAFVDAHDKAHKYKDVTDDYWASDYIKSVTEIGIMVGMPDGKFHPEKEVSRAEFAIIINNLLDRSADKPFINKSNELKRFTDENDKYWAYYDIRIATNSYAYQVKNKTENNLTH